MHGVSSRGVIGLTRSLVLHVVVFVLSCEVPQEQCATIFLDANGRIVSDAHKDERMLWKEIAGRVDLKCLDY